ncbi:MAG: hypothetical protein ACO31U_06405, partial [Ilumatobacteraceae bacterium]
MPTPSESNKRTQPTPPIAFGGGVIRSRWKVAAPSGEEGVGHGADVGVTALLRDLAAVCPTSTEHLMLAEHARDWWPLAMRWALQ